MKALRNYPLNPTSKTSRDHFLCKYFLPYWNQEPLENMVKAFIIGTFTSDQCLQSTVWTFSLKWFNDISMCWPQWLHFKYKVSILEAWFCRFVLTDLHVSCHEPKTQTKQSPQLPLSWPTWDYNIKGLKHIFRCVGR